MSEVMSAIRWQQIKEVFLSAVELDTSARHEFLADACAQDDELRAEVEKMMAADEEAAEFLESSPAEKLAGACLTGSVSDLQHLGCWRLVQELGHGGMGVVYLAERNDGQFAQQAAIKIIRRGMDSAELLRRFHTERQILASLNHPYIARLLDGGTTPDGRPWYVMEFINGKPLDEYCDEHRLSLSERLLLFRKICSAVQYAHQRLIIHRDLKPSNIMVTEEGEVKLLDFGIARLMTPETDDPDFTATQFGLMTPAYASPEQVRGDNITTTSDIYSLGVILYELLTGHRPYHFPSARPDEIASAICDSEPPRPSLAVLCDSAATLSDASRLQIRNLSLVSGHPLYVWPPSVISKTRAESPDRLRRRLHGDLDNIVLKALRKDPQRRYASVEQFSEDLHRYLTGLPVRARRDTISYRLTRFMQRNKVPVAAVVIVLASLCTGIVTTWQQSLIAQRERALAERRFHDVRQLASSFLFKYHDKVADLPGSTPVREMIVRDATEYLDRLAQDAGDDRTLQLEVAQGWLKIGDVQGRPFLSNLGNTKDAISSYQKALQICEELEKRAAGNAAELSIKSMALQSLGVIHIRARMFTEAISELRQSVAIAQPLLAADSGNRDHQWLLSSASLYLGDALKWSGDNKGPMEHYQLALNLREALVKADDRNQKYIRGLAIVSQRLALLLASNSRQDKVALYQSLQFHQRAADLFQSVALANPENPQATRDAIDQKLMMAEALARTGQTAEALEFCHSAATSFEKLAGADPDNAEFRRDIATAWYIAATISQDTGQIAAGVRYMLKSMATYEKLAAGDPANADNYVELANGYGRLSAMEVQRGNHESARQYKNRSDDYRRRSRTVQSTLTD